MGIDDKTTALDKVLTRAGELVNLRSVINGLHSDELPDGIRALAVSMRPPARRISRGHWMAVPPVMPCCSGRSSMSCAAERRGSRTRNVVPSRSVDVTITVPP